MNMENLARFDTIESDRRKRDVVFRDNFREDEIDLGELLLSIAGEWRAMALMILAGLLGSLVAVLVLPKTYSIDAILRVPTLAEMGGLKKQRLMEVIPEQVFERFVDQLHSYRIQELTLENSDWHNLRSESDEISIAQKTQSIRRDLSVNRVVHDHYDLKKNEKAPFKDIVISLRSSEPEYAADYLQRLVERAHESALAGIAEDLRTIKQNRIDRLEEHLLNLSQAAKKSRKAEITRLLETNQQKTAELEQQIELKIGKAKRERDDRLVQIKEAVMVAERLQLKEPVTWDDLRPLRESAQVVNDLGGKDDTLPLYFWGTRLLNAELERLQQREDVTAFVPGLVDLENQVELIRNDTRIAALQARPDDSIYIEKFDELQRELADLYEQDTNFGNARLAVVTQPPLVPAAPNQNPLLILVFGIFLSGFLALLVALVRIVVRNSRQKSAMQTVSE